MVSGEHVARVTRARVEGRLRRYVAFSGVLLWVGGEEERGLGDEAWPVLQCYAQTGSAIDLPALRMGYMRKQRRHTIVNAPRGNSQSLIITPHGKLVLGLTAGEAEKTSLPRVLHRDFGPTLSYIVYGDLEVGSGFIPPRRLRHHVPVPLAPVQQVFTEFVGESVLYSDSPLPLIRGVPEERQVTARNTTDQDLEWSLALESLQRPSGRTRPFPAIPTDHGHRRYYDSPLISPDQAWRLVEYVLGLDRPSVVVLRVPGRFPHKILPTRARGTGLQDTIVVLDARDDVLWLRQLDF
ncbi:hypothetical protein GMRT_12640 [Giardia muris]|uniref:Uncharacterized protein n=1 Tax=Giardia muris TaxID=5742 RepID=A0A4Z1SQ81_GIAMU|nr:hypothetical protein GMRT_12640 [Giardia muris]|eukprot:TNJ27830.1 hypothetical protein GMRT_12640 [Giardia muris]